MGTSIANESGRDLAVPFLTAAGIGAAGIIGAKSMLPGCSNEKGASAEGDAWDLETDIVVVGSGAAGVAAAVTAIEEGLRSYGREGRPHRWSDKCDRPVLRPNVFAGNSAEF